MERLLIEIRAAEGGVDAKLLVSDQFAIYAKAAGREHL
jgi:protein subunit release factor A